MTLTSISNLISRLYAFNPSTSSTTLITLMPRLDPSELGYVDLIYSPELKKRHAQVQYSWQELTRDPEPFYSNWGNCAVE